MLMPDPWKVLSSHVDQSYRIFTIRTDKEDIRVVHHRLPDIPALIASGRISHSLVLSAFFLYFLGSSQVDNPIRS